MTNSRFSNTGAVASDGEHKKELFVKKVEEVYGSLATGILENISHARYETFRINPLSERPEIVLEELKKLGFNIKEGPFKYSYVNYTRDLKVSQTDLFEKGKIYVQGLSSMLDVIILDPKPGEKILDLCASPGSKTSYICSLTGISSDVYAVENNTSRFFSMKKNLATQGHSEAVTLKENAVDIIRKHPELAGFFDKVLVDVPCTNEGNIRLGDENPLKYWNPKLPRKIQMLQKRLLAAGYNSLKKGGSLVYSTCTYSIEENEAVVNWALRKFSDLDIVKIATSFSDCKIVGGVTEYHGKKLDTRLSGSVRIIPNDFYDGFFIALFQRQS